MAFDAFFMGAVLNEIREKALGGRVEKIHQPSRDTVILQLRCEGGREKLLIAVQPADRIWQKKITLPFSCRKLEKCFGNAECELAGNGKICLSGNGKACGIWKIR